MGKIWITYLVCLALFSPMVYAQELVPATSEDIMEFDRQIAESLERTPAPAKKDVGLGAAVREEARKLKDSEAEDKKGRAFGKWVSDQRKKSDQGRPTEGGIGAGVGHSPDGARGGGSKGKDKKKNK